MAEINGFLGRQVRLCISDPEIPDDWPFIAEAGLRSKSVVYRNDPVDVSDQVSHGWREILPCPRVKSVEISFSGLATLENYFRLMRQFYRADETFHRTLLVDHGAGTGFSAVDIAGIRDDPGFTSEEDIALRKTVRAQERFHNFYYSYNGKETDGAFVKSLEMNAEHSGIVSFSMTLLASGKQPFSQIYSVTAPHVP